MREKLIHTYTPQGCVNGAGKTRSYGAVISRS